MLQKLPPTTPSRADEPHSTRPFEEAVTVAGSPRGLSDLSLIAYASIMNLIGMWLAMMFDGVRGRDRHGR
jgi:hypothetical protein